MAPSSRPCNFSRVSVSPSSRSRSKHKSRAQRGASGSPSRRTAKLMRARRISNSQKSRSPSPPCDHNKAPRGPILASLAPHCKGWLHREQVVALAHAHSHSRRSPTTTTTGHLEHRKQQGKLKPKPRAIRENQSMRARELNWRRTSNIAPNEGLFGDEYVNSEPRRGRTPAKHQGEKRDESRPLTPTKPLPHPQPKGTQSPRSPRNPLSPTSFLDQMTQKLGLTSPTFDGPSVLLKRPTMKGTSGIAKKVFVNHFKCIQRPKGNISKYKMEITPTVDQHKFWAIKRAWETQIVDTILGGHYIAYDGKENVLTNFPLSFIKNSFLFNYKTSEQRPPEPYTIALAVTSKNKRTLSSTGLDDFLSGKATECPTEYVAALNCVLKQSARKNVLQIGQSWFDAKHEPCQASARGVKLLTGFTKTFLPTQQGLSLVVDTTSRIFHTKQSVLTFVMEMFPKRDLKKTGFKDDERERIDRALRGMAVATNHYANQQVRRHGIVGLTKLDSTKLTFTNRLEKTTTVRDYFKEFHGLELQFYMLPCLILGSKVANYMPMELCTIVENQKLRMKIRHPAGDLFKTCKVASTGERLNKVVQMMEKTYKSLDDQHMCRDPYLNTFNFSFDMKPTRTTARVLVPPELEFGDRVVVKPTAGSCLWTCSSNFLDSAEIEYWGVLNMCFGNFGEAQIAEVMVELIRKLRAMGMKVQNKYEFVSVRHQDVSLALKTVNTVVTESMDKIDKESDKKVDLIVVFVDERKRNPLYNEIKRFGDCILGVPTQVIASEFHKQSSHHKNTHVTTLAFKINAKLGGCNMKLHQHTFSGLNSFAHRTWAAFGADVAHPDPGEVSPSLAAVVGSVDYYCTRFRATMRQQTAHETIIQDLASMVSELLREYMRANKNLLPEIIFFYRDGIDNREFKKVLSTEYAQIKSGAHAVQSNYDPKVTLVVVSTKHPTRLFLDDSITSSANVPAGTVVDEDVCHPQEFDFYLCSQAGGAHGTSRPAHYHVLCDEANLKIDDLQNVTNSLCYIYQRSTKAVSLPAPVLYARRSAIRAQQLYAATKALLTTEEAKSSKDLSIPPIHDNIKNKMFFL